MKTLPNLRNPGGPVNKPVLFKPGVIHSRIPAHAINPIPVQHPATSNSVSNHIKPFGSGIKS